MPHSRVTSTLIVFLLVFVGIVPLATAGPVIQLYNPHAAAVGGTVVLTGTGFGTTQGSSTVTFNGILATVSYWSSTQINVAVPVGATTGNIVVKVGGVNSAGKSFIVAPPPSITSISPSSGPIGTTITITGSSFLAGGQGGASSVWFYQNGSCPSCNVDAGSPVTNSDTTITVQVPAGATTGLLEVNNTGVDSNPVSFTVTGKLAPIANAGIDNAVPVATTVHLDGSRSYDPAGLSLTY